MGVDGNIFDRGSIRKTLFKFAVPSVISLLVAELYNLVDTIFVGRYVSANAIGALTIAFPIQRFLISIGMLIAVGTSTLVARSLGEKNYDNLKQGIVNAFSLAIIVMSLISFVIFVFKRPIVINLGASEIIYPLVDEYISIILIGAIFQCLGLVMSQIMTVLGDTKVALNGNLIGAIANTILDFILVFLFSKGIGGAAIATVLSQILSFIFVLYKFRRVKKTFDIKIGFELNKSIIWTIVAVGFSAFIIEISDAINGAVLNNLLYKNGGDAAVIMVGIVTKLSMFMYITIIGISSAMQPIVAYNFGALNFKKMKEAIKVAIKTVIITSIGFWIIFMIFSKNIIGFFLKEQALIPKTVSAFRVCILILPCVSIYYITIYYYQAVGESKKSFLLSIYRQIVVFIPVVIVLVGRFGVKGAWISYPLTDIIAAVTSVYFIKKALEDIEREDIDIDYKDDKIFEGINKL